MVPGDPYSENALPFPANADAVTIGCPDLYVSRAQQWVIAPQAGNGHS